MGSSALTWSGQAIGKEFIDKLLYVQHVDKKKDKTSELSERTLRDLLADDRKVCEDSTNSTENGGNPDESNLDILKSFLKDRITEVSICSNPLSISFEPLTKRKPKDAFHAFVVFTTLNTTNSKKKKMWWSLEKNTQSIVLQQSTQMNDVLNKIYDAKEGQRLERYGEVKLKKWAMGNDTTLQHLLRVIWENNQIIHRYNLLYSNCQNFASFIFEKLNGQNEKWSTSVSSIFGRLSGRKKKTGIELNAIMHKSMVNDDKFDFYKAMMDGRRKDFEELINNLASQCLNSVDFQGYTLLEWATVFSTSDWPIDEELKKKGAEIPSDEGLFRQNVYFITLQYLPPNQESKLFDSFDGIDITSVNGTGDTALHLALYGEKWKIAEEILCKFEDDEVNSTNSLGETPLHLASRLECEFGLFNKIQNRTKKENVNKVDGNGWTALHYAINEESGTKVKELLNHTDVDVNVQNNEDYCTALHLASKWPTIPADLFQIILDKSTDFNAQDVNGNTALHYAIMTKSETAVKALLKQKGVNVKNNRDVIALHLVCNCENFPMDLFKQILKDTNDINAQDEDGCTALHYAICKLKSKTAVKELLTRSDLEFNVKDNGKHTALHYASMWTKIPMDLFKRIIENSADIINAQDVNGNTALHFAIRTKFETAVKKLLNHKDVDVNVANNEKILPLHLACICEEDIPMDLFKKILKKTIDINAQDNDGKTALHWAIWKLKSKTKVEELLNDNRVEINVETHENFTTLHFASCWKDIPMDLFKRILKKTTNINAKTKNGNTALHTAVLNNFQKAITALLKHKDVDVSVKNYKNRTALHNVLKWPNIPADLSERIRIEYPDINNAQDEEGKTVVHPTMFKRFKTAVKELLKFKNVNVKPKNEKGRTALHLVCMSRDDIPDNLIKIIIRQSSDINAQDNKGDTALHIAIRNRNFVAVKELREREDLDVNIKNNKNETAFHESILFHYIASWQTQRGFRNLNIP